MNYLAHIYLSNEDNDIKLGNFFSDFIKGNKYKHFSKGIQNGIYLHRQIDSFTDAHKIVRISKRRLHERYGHFDGIIIDILYDHFLAKNWLNYSDIPLKKYENDFLILLENNFDILPETTQQALPFMQKQKWISSYASLEGIERVLNGVNKRTKYKSQMHLAIEDLKQNYKELENDFIQFFSDLIIFTDKIIAEFDKPKNSL
jgi:acyl carrier protein phosphodiesterase